jgi:hypothetical protein
VSRIEESIVGVYHFHVKNEFPAKHNRRNTSTTMKVEKRAKRKEERRGEKRGEERRRD